MKQQITNISTGVFYWTVAGFFWYAALWFHQMHDWKSAFQVICFIYAVRFAKYET